MSSFRRLVRFAQGDLVHYGDLINSVGNEFTIRKLTGSPFGKLGQTDEIVKTGRVSCMWLFVPDYAMISLYDLSATLSSRPYPINHLHRLELPFTCPGSKGMPRYILRFTCKTIANLRRSLPFQDNPLFLPSRQMLYPGRPTAFTHIPMRARC